MDDAIKLKTADISAAAAATCHFMVTLSPSIERDPAAVLWQYFENALGLITKDRRVLCSSLRVAVRFHAKAEAHPACYAAPQAMRGRRQKGVL
jgi:hypothetical protein